MPYVRGGLTTDSAYGRLFCGSSSSIGEGSLLPPHPTALLQVARVRCVLACAACQAAPMNEHTHALLYGLCLPLPLLMSLSVFLLQAVACNSSAFAAVCAADAPFSLAFSASNAAAVGNCSAATAALKRYGTACFVLRLECVWFSHIDAVCVHLLCCCCCCCCAASNSAFAANSDSATIVSPVCSTGGTAGEFNCTVSSGFPGDSPLSCTPRAPYP